MSTLSFDRLNKMVGGDARRSSALHALLRLAVRTRRIADPEQAWRDDPDPWGKLKADPETRHMIEQWCALIAGHHMDISTDGKSEEDAALASLMSDLVGHIRGLHEAKAMLAQARFIGSAHARIHGEHRMLTLGDGRQRRWWVPTRLVDVGRERFELRNVGRGLEWFFLGLDARWTPLRPIAHHFVRHMHGAAEDNLFQGEGIIRPLYIWQHLKGSLLKIGVQGADRWALGILNAGLDGMRNPDGTSNETLIQTWADVLAQLRQEGILIRDKEDELEVVETSGSGHQLVTSLIDMMTTGMRVLVLGSNLPTEATGGGSFALAKVQETSTELLVRQHRKSLAETLSEQVIGPTLAANARNLEELGLLAARRPYYSAEAEGREDPSTRASVIAQIAGTFPSLPIVMDDVYEQAGLTVPDPSRDRTITAAEGRGETLGAQEAPAPAKPPVAEAAAPEPLPSDEELARHPTSAAEIGEKLGIGPATVRRWTQIGCPHLRLPGGRVRFSDADVAAWIAAEHARRVPMAMAEQQRCPDGTFEPKSGVCPEHVAEEKKTPPARRAPGAQFDEGTRARFKELGLKKLPPADIPAEQVEMNLSGPDIDERAVIKWTDAKGRVQREYTARFHERSAKKKWDRVMAFERRADAATGSLASKVETATPGSREHAAATIALLIARTGMRPGGTGDSEARGVFGASTLRPEHVTIAGDAVTFNFVGKSAKENTWGVRDALLAQAIGSYVERAKPGERLFPATVQDAADANRSAGGGKLKDWRTLAATRQARNAFAATRPPPPLEPPGKKRDRQLRDAMRAVEEEVAKRLNNTPAVARSSYIHPEVYASWRRTIGAE